MSTETTAASTSTTSVTVRFYAGAAEAAGTEEVRLPLTGSRSLDSFLTELPALLPSPGEEAGAASSAPPLERVCARSSFLVNGVRTKRETGTLSPGDQLDVLPPFAGG